MVNGEIPPRPAGDWRLAHTRFTAFGEAGKWPESAEFFGELFGFPPEDESRKKQEMKVEFSARVGCVNHMLAVQAGKLDIVISPVAPEEIPVEIPYLADWAACREHVKKMSFKVLAGDYSISRIAVGEQWLLPVQSRHEGYSGLGFFLAGVDMDPAGSKDFFYRINRPRRWQSKEWEIEINRLTTWGSISLHLVGPNLMATRGGDCVSVTTDINTIPESKFISLPPDARQDLAKVLFEYSAEMTEKGDSK